MLQPPQSDRKPGRPSSGMIKRTYRFSPTDLLGLAALAALKGTDQATQLRRALAALLLRELPVPTPEDQGSTSNRSTDCDLRD